MLRLLKVILLWALFVFVLLAVISRYLPPGVRGHQHKYQLIPHTGP